MQATNLTPGNTLRVRFHLGRPEHGTSAVLPMTTLVDIQSVTDGVVVGINENEETVELDLNESTVTVTDAMGPLGGTIAWWEAHE